MPDPELIRPVPRWVRVAAAVTLVLAFGLLALGGFVTSFRAGMADPVWPTEPWYLFDNYQDSRAYLIEHVHRIAGWTVGLAVTVLALGTWWYEPDATLRRTGLAAMLALLVAYGEFHRAMRAAGGVPRDGLPLVGWVTIGLAGTVLALGLAAAQRSAGGPVRAAAAWGLVFVMTQGLLGGFRVSLNAWAGTDLAAVHGAFGQVAFCVLVAAAVFAAPRRAGDAPDGPDRSAVVRLGRIVVGLLFVQLVWAVMLRHAGTALAQRLHLLTAFAVTAAAVWLGVRLLARPAFRGQGVHLLGVLAVQLLLGVEAYVGKFAAVGPHAQTPPELRPVSVGQAATRTAHQLVGAGLLGSAVAVSLRLGRRPVVPGEAEPEPEFAAEPAAAP
jgi:heme A synthase